MALIPTLDSSLKLRKKFLSAQSLSELAVEANVWRTAQDNRYVTRAEYVAGGSGIAPTIFDAKGDLIVASAADTPLRLAVGANGRQLIADSNDVAGMKWAERPALYTNLLTNPSVETNTTTISAVGSGATVSRVTTEFYSGLASVRAVCDGTTSGQGVQWTSPSLTNAVYTASFWVKAPAGTLLTLSFASVNPAFTATGDWQRVTATSQTSGVQGIRVVTNGAQATTFYVDTALLIAGTDMPDYFDGDTAGCYWTGTAHASTSVRAALSATDGVGRASLPVITRNLVANPSFELGTTGWAGYNSGTVSRATTLPFVGVGRLAINTSGTVADSGAELSGRIRVSPSTTYTASAFVFGQVSRTVALQVAWFDEAGSSVGTPTTRTFVANGAYQREAVTATAPTTAATAAIRCYYPGTLAASSIILDGAQFEQGARATEYVDGDQKGCYWTGAPHASESVRVVRAGETVTKLDAPELARNYIINPGAETNTTAALAINAGVTVTRTTAEAQSGAASIQVVTPGTAAAEGVRFTSTTSTGGLGNVAPAGYYAAGAWVKATAGALLAVAVQALDGFSGVASTPFTATGSWQWVASPSLLTTAASNITATVRTQGTLAATFFVDSVIATQSTGPLAPTAYFDGDSPGCYWLGTPHQSPSAKYLLNRAETMVERDITGTGSPEGVYAAPVGTVYTDTAATNGAIRWVKATGTGSTGWKVQYGDTGWRDITADLVNGSTATFVRIRRHGDQVTLAVSGLAVTGLNVVYANIATGFQPAIGAHVTLREDAVSGAFLAGTWSNTANIRAVLTNETPNYTTWRFSSLTTALTTQAWPTTLPGTAA